ncbi:MAG: hypothetical protein E6R13_04420 [Spirochaetes bacterium]|nr:MAG: hypothetical protein E6R13_04420 [Spirochaetota bacterium]
MILLYSYWPRSCCSSFKKDMVSWCGFLFYYYSKNNLYLKESLNKTNMEYSKSSCKYDFYRYSGSKCSYNYSMNYSWSGSFIGDKND